jgi:tetratricopeptide (TPR) repeat protein
MLGAALVFMPLGVSAVAQSIGSSGRSWTDSITSPFKKGYDALKSPFTGKKSVDAVVVEDNAISLNSPSKAGPEVYVALARVYQQSGRTAEAEQQYRLALRNRPNDLPAMLGYAQLQDQLGRTKEALELYQRAVKAYPREASVHNNLGLCYARQKRLDEAADAMNRAIQLDSQNPLFRNNIATVLVDLGRVDEAFGQLSAVHEDAAAHYNLGYLLNKKGQSLDALQHFHTALKSDPSMDVARQWAEHLEKTTAQARLAHHPSGLGVRVVGQPVMPPQDSLLPPEAPMARRLPPVTWQRPEEDDSRLPGIANDRGISADAPLPPMPPPTSRPLRGMN